MANNRKGSIVNIIRQIQTPLGFYVLALLIIEGTMGLVLTMAKLSDDKRWEGFLFMIGVFAAVVVIVTMLTICAPRNLLYGKEEHSTPALDQSALKDQIEDLIALNVKTECLKNPENKLK